MACCFPKRSAATAPMPLSSDKSSSMNKNKHSDHRSKQNSSGDIVDPDEKSQKKQITIRIQSPPNLNNVNIPLFSPLEEIKDVYSNGVCRDRDADLFLSSPSVKSPTHFTSRLDPTASIFVSAEVGPPFPQVHVWKFGSGFRDGGKKSPKSVHPEDDGAEITTLAKFYLSSEFEYVSAVEFTRDGNFLMVVACNDDISQLFIFDWKKQISVCQNLPNIPERVLSVISKPWSNKLEFITLGEQICRFWTLEHNNSTQSATFNDAVYEEDVEIDGRNHLCGIFTKQKNLVTGSLNGDITFWKQNKVYGPVLCLTPHNSPQISFLSGGHDARILIWNDQNQPITEYKFDSNRQIRSLNTLFSGGNSGSWFGWTPKFVNRSSTLLRFGSKSSNKSLNRNSLMRKKGIESVGGAVDLVLVGCGDSSVWEIDLKSGMRSLLVEAHDVSDHKEIWGLSTHPKDLNIFITGGDDGWIRIWNTKSPTTTIDRTTSTPTKTTTVQKRKNLNVPIRCCSFRNDGKFIAVGFTDGSFTILNPDLTTYHQAIKHRKETIHCIKYSPNNKFLAVGSHDNYIDIYKVNESMSGFGEDSLGCEYQRIMCCRGHSSFVCNLDWSVDSTKLRSNSGNSEVMFWTIEHPSTSSPVEFKDISWSETSCTLSWGTKGIYGNSPSKTNNSDNKQISSTELVNSNCEFGLRQISSVKSSPNGKFLVVGSLDGQVHVLNFPASNRNVSK
ncbi:hypothetical protein HK098_000535 [Nowakowskiella sp. JEL0407]|nr:hypothetical protein HK098_000535 [Nowakowskiella sp. JEL0407]